MILHLMIFSTITKSYIEFCNLNFDRTEHIFYVYRGNNEHKIEIKKEKNVITLNTKFELIKFYIKLFFKNDYRKIYIHGFYLPYLSLVYFLKKDLLKKSNWIVWGRDLYCYEKRKKGVKYKILYYIEDYVKRNIAYVNTLVPGDYEIAKKYYKIRGKYKKAQYVSYNNFEYIDSLMGKQKDEIYIQIGNSATPSNNHFEIIDLLSKFKEEKIKIYAVLSYGDEIYAQKVNEYGKKIFGEKFIGIITFMEKNKYWEYLKDIDILVFNHQRQQGLGNITMLSYLEKKIYLRKDVSSWEYLTEDIGLKLNSFEEIKNQTFREFITNNSKGNKEKILTTVYSNEYRKNIWEENFNS